MGYGIFNSTPGKKAGNAKREDGESNRVIAGNSDNGGAANVNWNHPGNPNDNIGFRLAVVSSPAEGKQCDLLLCLMGGSHCYIEALIQPPSILPISCKYDSRRRYFLLSKIFKSLQSLMRTFNRSSFILVFCKTGSFSDFDSWLAVTIPSIISSIISSIFCPIVYRSFLGKCGAN